MDETPIPAGTDASAWADRLKHSWKVELSNGWAIWCQTPDWQQLLAAGQIPNELETFILYDDFIVRPYKSDGDTVKRKTDVELSIDQAERWKNKERIVARTAISPRVRLKGTPNYVAGEISISDLTPNEIHDIAWIAVRRAVPPPPAMFPEPTTAEPDGIETSGELGSSDPAPHAPESLDRTEGE